MLDAERVRIFLQDDEKFNILLDNEQQFTDDFIDEIISITYAEVAAIIPALRNTTKKVPDMIILHGVLGNLMRSESFKEIRNQLQYSDSNLSSISIFHKHTDYLALSSGLKSEFVTMLNSYSAASFINSAWGGNTSNSSDYDSLYAFIGNDFFSIGASL